MCVATFRIKLLSLVTTQTFPRDQPERDASGGAILRPCCRIPIMLAVLVPCHSRRWFPGTPQFFKRSAFPNRETLKTASTSILCLPPEMSNVNEIITTGTLLVIKLLSRPITTNEKKFHRPTVWPALSPAKRVRRASYEKLWLAKKSARICVLFLPISGVSV